MIISINTDVLNEMAQLAITISNEISSAHAALTPVVEHNDWNCSERDSINEMISALKKYGLKIKDISENYSVTLQRTANDFEEFEKETPDALQESYSKLGQSLSIKSPTSITSVPKAFNEIMNNNNFGRNITCGLTRYQFEQMNKPLVVIPFKPTTPGDREFDAIKFDEQMARITRIIGGKGGLKPKEPIFLNGFKKE